ncbi:hypothetical protein BC831DRAFT_462104 [Entophlyctis helioformis]|nr:hypothetical protein BC831DRAFT_462104 [Entophlyctis helioformis]
MLSAAPVASAMPVMSSTSLPGAVANELGVPAYRGKALHGVKKQGVAVKSPASGNETAVYRSVLSPNELLRGFPDIATVHELINTVGRLHADKPALGSRIPSIDPATGAVTWSPYAFQTYSQLAKSRTDFGCGLQHIYNNVIKGDRTAEWCLGICSVNRAEWVIADFGAQAFSIPVVALYDTLGPDASEFILNHADVSIIVATVDKVPFLLSLGSKAPKLRAIIAIDPFPSAKPKMGAMSPIDVCKQWAAEKGMGLFSFQEVLDLGVKHSIAFRPPTADSTLTLCYTSGTTGNPKGAILTHGNMMSILRSANTLYGIVSSDLHLSYLPLAHIFERAVLLSALSAVSLLIEDIGVLRPTVFASVPRLLNRIYDRINQQALHSGSALKASLFQYALDAKIDGLRSSNTLTHWLWDSLVFSKAQALLGGRVRLIVTASAPISGQVVEFLRVVFGCQTECTGGLTSTWPGDLSSEINEMKLVSVPEMNYLAANNQGEVWTRGPNVFKGYYKDVAKTKEALTDDGWLMTGDIGSINEDGKLAIIDRKKNIFKLAQGEYVAPEKIESTYNKSGFVAQIFVHGDSLQSELVAIVVPDPEVVVKWAIANGHLEADSVKVSQVVQQTAGLTPHPVMVDLCRKRELKEAVMADMVAAIHLVPVMFTLEAGLLTPTFKLKRHDAAIAFREHIDALYASRQLAHTATAQAGR